MTDIKKFVSKQIIIEAMEYTGTNSKEICEWCNACRDMGNLIFLSPGDWITGQVLYPGDMVIKYKDDGFNWHSKEGFKEKYEPYD
jgi:hypothetical protein